MSLYTTPVSQLTTADLQELITDNAVENVRLEFKSAAPNKDELLKKSSSFANTFGGFLLIGAKADSKDGRIQDLPGVDPENRYKQKVVQWCFDGASPPLVVEVSDPIPAPGANGKVCYIIFVAESDVAPHFLNNRKGVWVRTDEFSARFETQLADENELKHLFDRRRLVRERRVRLVERARKRFDTYIGKKHTDLGGKRTKVGPLLEFSVIPRFPSRQICEQEMLEGYVKKYYMDWRQQIFPDFTRRQVLRQHESAIVLDAAAGRTSIVEVNVWGSLYYGVELETQYPNEAKGIHPYEFVGYVLLFVRHSGQILRAMGYSGPLLIDVFLSSVLGVPWLQPQFGGIFPGPNSELDDAIALPLATASEAFIQRPDGIAIEIIRDIFFSVNWPELVETAESTERLIRMGCEFNLWPKSSKLKT